MSDNIDSPEAISAFLDAVREIQLKNDSKEPITSIIEEDKASVHSTIETFPDCVDQADENVPNAPQSDPNSTEKEVTSEVTENDNECNGKTTLPNFSDIVKESPSFTFRSESGTELPEEEQASTKSAGGDDLSAVPDETFAQFDTGDKINDEGESRSLLDVIMAKELPSCGCNKAEDSRKHGTHPSVPVKRESDKVTDFGDFSSGLSILHASQDREELNKHRDNKDDENHDQTSIDDPERRSNGQEKAFSISKPGVREVIISSLPRNTDFTLVQSLIYGDGIESMTLGKDRHSESRMVASVMLTSEKRCSDYLEKHQYGVIFQYEGKQCHAFVKKGINNETTTELMRGYLDCGASRVLKVVAANSHMNMQSLKILAEGALGERKMEKITDQLRGEVRTVYFHFTSIFDAVRFKNELSQNQDWFNCDILFTEDPCRKAVGIHLE